MQTKTIELTIKPQNKPRIIPFFLIIFEAIYVEIKIPNPLTMVVNLFISVGEKFENKTTKDSRTNRINRIIKAIMVKNAVSLKVFFNFILSNFKPPNNN